MTEVKSVDDQMNIMSQADVTDITSKTEYSYTSRSDLQVESKSELKAYARAQSLGKLQETWMARGCDLSDEDILAECESVRQELYDKYIAPTRK